MRKKIRALVQRGIAPRFKRPSAYACGSRWCSMQLRCQLGRKCPSLTRK